MQGRRSVSSAGRGGVGARHLGLRASFTTAAGLIPMLGKALCENHLESAAAQLAPGQETAHGAPHWQPSRGKRLQLRPGRAIFN
jgi:hypothetical protein